MKAVLKEDMIISAGMFGVEIGAPIKGVGLERLRFDGNDLVDLMDVSVIHVRHLSGTQFELHCVSVAGSQQVTMTYADRHRLTIDPDGAIRLKTQSEIDSETAQTTADGKRANIEAELYRDVGKLISLLLYMLKMLYALTFFSRNPTSAPMQAFLDAIIPHVKDTFPADAATRDQLIAMSDKIKGIIDRFQ